VEWRLFDGLPEPQRRRLTEASRRRRFGRGEVLFHEGDLGDSVHQIRTGSVAVRVTTSEGALATLVVLGPGDFFGELGLLLSHRTRTATAVALEPTETEALAYSTFDALRLREPSVDRFLLGLLAGQVDRLSHRLLEALYVSVDRRVARRLLDLVAIYGGTAAGPVTVPLTQNELADLAGGSRPTVNEILQRLAAQGAVSLGRGRVVVQDRAALERRAGL
jgi:CRP/FNR family transcriptional regulator, cyclic AMP receptor protein